MGQRLHDVHGIAWISRTILHTSAIVVDMFASFPSKVDKRCVDANSGHTLAWDWSSGMHMSEIGSVDRSKLQGRLACQQGWFNTCSLPKGPMNAHDPLSRKHILHTVFSFPTRSEEFQIRKPWVVNGICCWSVCSEGYDELWGISLIIIVRKLINSFIYMNPNDRIVTLVPSIEPHLLISQFPAP